MGLSGRDENTREGALFKPVTEKAQQVHARLPDFVRQQMADGENPLRVIRRHRLMTQKELSDLTGMSESHISNIESGSNFSIRTAKKLATALRVTIDDIS